MRHFLAIADLTREDVLELLRIAVKLKRDWKAALAARTRQPALLDGYVLGMVFEKPSLRTRCAFEAGMFQLGGHAINLSVHEVGRLGEREAISDVARNLSRWCQIIQARVYSHESVLKLAEWSTVPVINGLSDFDHPTQILADYVTILEERGSVENFKLSWIGDSFNVSNSLMSMAAILGHEMTMAVPKGYEPSPEIWAVCERLNPNARKLIKIVHDPKEAAKGADALYTDIWVSMGHEHETAKRENDFLGYQINNEILSLAPKHAIVMHDMPAKRGKEITSEVLDGPQSRAFEQAENRLHSIKAIMCWCLGVQV